MSFLDAYDLNQARDIWVVAELAAGQPTPLTLELVGGARMLADGLGCYVHVLVMGSGLDELPDLIAAGADRLHIADDPALADGAVEPALKVLGDLFAAQRPEIVLFGATSHGDALAPRLAEQLETGLLARCTALRMDEVERVLIGTRPVYDGEYMLVAACPHARPEIVTVLPDTFGPPYLDSYRYGETERLTVEISQAPARVRHVGQVSFTPPPAPLRKARRIVSAGRQAGNWEAVTRLAQALEAQVAGAREAMDEGWVTADQVVGVLGESVRPDLYVAMGIRGDSHHAFGIRDARFVVALYPEANAPIFKVADAGLVGDPAELAARLIEALGETV